jgi:putative nucleotidyltransferase with HDIG domain
MPSLGPRSTDFHRLTAGSEARARENRKARVMAIVADGLPTPQGRIFELVRLLSEPVMDLGGVTEIIRSEPLLNVQILGLLNSTSSEEPRQTMEFSEAVVLLGAERLRILASGCALAEFAGRHLPIETMRAFWYHSLLTGVLSEKIAREAEPESVERAYLGGLLHDIGRLPLLIAEHEEEARAARTTGCVHDQPACERSHFGVDHCEVGRWIALSGNFSSWMVDVVEHHHDPSRAAEDANLVAIVTAADRYSQSSSQFDAREESTWPDEVQSYADLLTRTRPRWLLEDNRAAQSQFLENSPLDSPFPSFGSS